MHLETCRELVIRLQAEHLGSIATILGASAGPAGAFFLGAAASYFGGLIGEALYDFVQKHYNGDLQAFLQDLPDLSGDLLHELTEAIENALTGQGQITETIVEPPVPPLPEQKDPPPPLPERKPEPPHVGPDGALSKPPVSPLVIDLDGDGIELISLEESNVQFDSDGDGFVEHIGWVSSDDAHLALDRNFNGRIDDISELFGNEDIDGFTELAELDSNNDGVIDASDERFEELVVWQDLNSNGFSEADELTSLTQAGITSINLNATLVDETLEGHDVTHRSVVNNSDGTTSEIVDVWYQNQQWLSTFVLDEDFEFALDAVLLPVLNGYGIVKDLNIAATLDDTLVTFGKELLAKVQEEDYAGFFRDFEGFVQSWVGASGVADEYGGGNVEGSHLATLEAFHGVEFYDLHGYDAGPNAGSALEEQYQLTIDALAARFLVQSYGAITSFSIFENGLFATNIFEGELPIDGEHLQFFSSLSLDFETDQISGDPSAIVAAMASTYLSDVSSNSFANLAGVLRVFKHDLDDGNGSYIQLVRDTLTANGLDAATVDAVSEFVSAGIIEVGSLEADTIVGSDYDEVLVGRAGDDTLQGEGGSDRYLYEVGDGHDTISESGYWATTETDSLQFVGDEFVLSNLHIEVLADQNDVKLTFSGVDGSVTLDQQLFSETGQFSLEFIQFGDGQSLSDMGLRSFYIEQETTDGNDTIVGLAGADTIEASLGNDVLKGEGGSDLYIYRNGYGDDTISESGSWASSETDVLQFIGDEFVLSNLHVERLADANDAKLTFSGVVGSVTLDQQFYSEGGHYSLEMIQFNGGQSLSASELRAFYLGQESTDGQDVINGFDGDDIVEAGLGDDTVYGEGGSDVYVYRSGDGNDIISDTGGISDEDKVLLADLTAADIQVQRSQVNNNDLIITIVATGATITVVNHFAGSISGLEFIEFSDGSTWDRGDIDTHSAEVVDDNVIVGTVGSDTLYGTSGDDVYRGGLGDDWIQTGAGSDTFVWQKGDGNDWINEASGSTTDIDTLEFVDVDQTDVLLIHSGNDLLVEIISTGEVIEIDEHFWSPWSNWGIEQIQFADGTVWDHNTIQTQARLIGTDGVDTLLGTSNIYVFQGGAGDDFINSAGSSSDTFIWQKGDGNDWINEGSGSTTDVDTLQFLDVNQGEISLTHSGYDLLIEISSTGEVIEIDEHFWSPSSNWGIEQIQFADGTIWDHDQINSEAKIRGTDGNDTLSGTSFGDNLLGGAGDDMLSGGAGDDAFLFDPQFGNDTITDFDVSGSDIIQFNTTLFATFADVQAAMSDVNGDVVIQVDQDNAVTIENTTISNLTTDDFRFVA